ncbi:hypothetical protein EW145_g2430 [Phellinidium pouzarii]|uniref:Uncharacterized protein n=1 Tax=Phellinidium pouzarii TaxID=167371 RepID=A0A4S4LAW9_9AGAM|nr:hypothetical protein EW145_g2430 [Phellinidium pouzarii]
MSTPSVLAKLVSSIRFNAPTPSTKVSHQLTMSAPIFDEFSCVNPRWATTKSFISLDEARATDAIVRRPVELLMVEELEQPTHIEVSWSPVVRFVSLEDAQRMNAIRRRAVDLL